MSRAPDPSAPTAARRGRPRRAYLAHTRPLFFAHRGGALEAPENTIAAFERGLAAGADALELDIQTTREGEIVVIHDPTLERTTNGAGPVSALTLDELGQLDAGYRFTTDGGATFPWRGAGVRVPTLRAVLERFPATRLNIDLKQSSPAREERLWALIQEYAAADRVLVASGDEHEPIVRFRRLAAGRVATSASEREIRAFVIAALGRVAWALRPAYDALQVPEVYGRVRVVSRTTVAAAHRAGLAVHVWTVDDRPAMERLLALGVDGLMTDRPEVLAEVLAARA
ncbi:MAG TPA: glycerophosphodiester phosphodiesterase [Ktedonobacterales bacterium]|nr:glycerophosphodiester phosphodiesterase [Ktedonobacterales bacterium]